MPELSLLPAPSAQSPAGLLLRGAQMGGVLAKLSARQSHYADLHLARGDGWLAFYSNQTGAQIALPWPGADALYLHRIAEGCFCQAGFRPNLPAGVLPRLGRYLAQTLPTELPTALIPHGDRVTAYALSPAHRVGDLAAEDLRA